MTTAAQTSPAADALARALAGSMLGTAVGDALGLPCEGLSPRRQLKMFPSLEHYSLLPGAGMVSDDTEHTVMLAQSLIASGGDPQRFSRQLAWRLRGWLAALPAGCGMATGRSIVKLWLCFPAARSGVRSAGNGPAMRAAVLGVAFGEDPQTLRQLNRIAARITHNDARAEDGALTVAVAAYLSATGSGDLPAPAFVRAMAQWLPEDSAMLASVRAVEASIAKAQSASEFVSGLGSRNGVSGYMLHTVPAVLHVWLRHQNDFMGGVTEMVRLGGDSDSTAAIVGGIIGARVGAQGIPPHLLRDLRDWPCSTVFVQRVAQRLALVRNSNARMRAVPVFWPAIPLRNLLFLLIVLAHGLRRMLPPY